MLLVMHLNFWTWLLQLDVLLLELSCWLNLVIVLLKALWLPNTVTCGWYMWRYWYIKLPNETLLEHLMWMNEHASAAALVDSTQRWGHFTYGKWLAVRTRFKKLTCSTEMYSWFCFPFTNLWNISISLLVSRRQWLQYLHLMC